MKRKSGRVEVSSVSGENVNAYVPDALPPKSPPLQLEKLQPLLKTAEENLRLLDVAGDLIPSIEWFVYAFVRKEAVLSAQIEGTQATLSDLLENEADASVPDADLEEVCSYLAAQNHAWTALHDEKGLPISLRLLNEIHQHLLQGARGAQKQPGEIRRSQNWIGGTRPGNALFVPPPPQLLPSLFRDFEVFIHDDSELPALIQVGLLHAQFETLHPYLDGNGRLGRMLIGMLLQHWGLLSRPLLYLSLYLKERRQEYYRLLNGVRNGEWEEWLAFFVEGVAQVAEGAVLTSRNLNSIIAKGRERLMSNDDSTMLSVRLFELLPEHLILNVLRVTQLLNCSRPAAGKALAILEKLDILSLHGDDKKRNRMLAFTDYLNVLCDEPV
ncbi:MAG: Fic family protein [Deltaproteobacteria bacterium]|nr:Fic family protein [Deltaproteobacteria bacterium]